MASQQAFDTYLDSLTPAEYEREFGAPGLDEGYADSFGPAGWTEALIEAYETDLEAAGVPSAYATAF